jgi:putative ABC transport system permease protein
MVYRQLGFREARKRPGRAILTLASVAIGVAAVVAVSFTTQTTRGAFDAIFRSLAGRASLEVAAPIGQSIPDSLAETISSIPGVEAVAPRLQRPTLLYAHTEQLKLIAAAVDLERDRKVHDYKIVAGKPLSQGNEVLLEQLLAANLGVSPGERIHLLTRSGRIGVKVAGLFKSSAAGMAGQGAGLLMSLRNGQRWFRAPKQLDVIQIVLAESVDEATVNAEIAQHLPENAELRAPAGRSSMAEETVLATNQALLMARAFILLVATFVIANTFLISVAQRRRQLGILRAIGATRGQVATLVLTEAVAMGIGGTILGSLLGIGISHLLTGTMGSIYDTKLPPIELTAAPFAWAALFGIGISLAGAMMPALKASRLAPIEALRDVLGEEMEGTSRWLIVGGATTVAACAGLLALSISGRLHADVAVFAGVFGLIGLVLILPIGLPTIAGGVARMLPGSFRTEARIASRQLLVHRSRTTLTVGVVFIAASAAIGLANTVLDNTEDIRDWYRKSMVADFYVRATMPDMATGMAADLPDGLDEELKEVAGVVELDASRLVSVNVAGENSILIVRDYDDSSLQQFDVVEGDQNEVSKQLADGQIVIGSVLAKRCKLKLGDEAQLQTKQGAPSFRIAAIVNDYHAGGLTVYMDRAVAERYLQVGGVDVYLVKADPAKIDEVRNQLLAVARNHGLLLQSLSDLQGEIDAMISGVEAGLWGLVALGLLIATFGVVNTLMISVLEQAIEFGLLRAIAATRGQIRKVIFAQALILGAMAMAPAVVAGVGIAYLINLSTYGVTGHVIEFQFRPWLSLAAFAGGLATIAVAAWAPAERASNVNLRGVLRVR